MLINCTNCNSEFDKKPSQFKKTKNHFCSRSCSATFNNKGIIRNKQVQRICCLCKEPFYRSGERLKICGTCKSNFKDKTEYSKHLTLEQLIERLSVKGKHPSWKFAQVRIFNREWNKELRLKPCSKCGYNKHVELAHIKAVSSFPLSATLGEINSPDNIIPLCPNCHWELDNGLLTL